jgi:hypothetical protein
MDAAQRFFLLGVAARGLSRCLYMLRRNMRDYEYSPESDIKKESHSWIET